MFRKLMRTTPSWALTVLRLGFGLMLMAHGSQKLFGAFDGPGLDGFAGYLAHHDVPLPLLAAWCSALAEFGGGVALVLGLCVRLATLPVMVNMIVAARVSHWQNGFFIQRGGFEYTAMIVVAMLCLLIAGGGAMSLDERLSAGPPGGKK